MKKIICTVTNDITHDRRMHRICRSLAEAGFDVTLIGREYANSPVLPSFPFQAFRMKLWFRKGKFFYIEYQIRLFFLLIFRRADILCAIDLDTILPVTLVGLLHRSKRVYDAHELFTEVPELAGRPFTTWLWRLVGKFCVPRMDLAYTVGPALAELLQKQYSTRFSVIRNLPQKTTFAHKPTLKNKVIWYQGALNQGRGLEVAIRAMRDLPDYQFWLAGEGDLSGSLRLLSTSLGLQDRIQFLGWINPDELMSYAEKASIGLNLLDGESQSYYYSLANKTFDYIQAGLPTLHMDFPEYRQLQNLGPIGVLLPELTPEVVVNGVLALEEGTSYASCQTACEQLSTALHWENEENVLVNLYQELSADLRVRG